ncbi:MAG: branched-chain amino acid ABC transporter permease [Salinarimonas sp.]
MNARDLATGFAPILLVVALLALVPLFVASNTVLNFLVFTLIIALAAQGWNLLAGYGGQFSFGHAAFFGTGAYAAAILQVNLGLNAYVAFLVGIGLGALVGFVIGYLSFRSGLRGSYFALVTLAFAEVLRILANSAGFTGGAAGILIPLEVSAWNFQFESRAAYYWVALALVGAVLVLVRAIERARFGAQLVAVRENEAAARALGVDAFAVKLKAIALSGAITAAAGGLYAQYFLYLDALIAYGPWISIEALLAPIVGGLGTVFGPLVGALALHGLSEGSKMFTGEIPGIDLVVFGVVLILVVAFTPDGIMGVLGRLRRRLAGSTANSTAKTAPLPAREEPAA